MSQQRRAMTDLGQRLGTPVLFLKAAWADPVLYSGRGERSGCDVDVLVSPEAFMAFGAALEREGYTRLVPTRHPVTNEAANEWCYSSRDGLYPIDLHRALVCEPWFRVPTQELLTRARDYDSDDGPVPSLSPEDQVVYTAIHHANHRFALDERHLEDTTRLLARYAVDWDVITARCKHGWLSLALWLVAEALAKRGAAVPLAELERTMSTSARLRRLWAERFVEVGPKIARTRRWSGPADIALLLSAISDRPSALPRFLARFARHRAAEALGRL